MVIQNDLSSSVGWISSLSGYGQVAQLLSTSLGQWETPRQVHTELRPS